MVRYEASDPTVTTAKLKKNPSRSSIRLSIVEISLFTLSIGHSLDSHEISLPINLSHRSLESLLLDPHRWSTESEEKSNQLSCSPWSSRASYPSQLSDIHGESSSIVNIVRCTGLSDILIGWIMFDMGLINCIGDISKITGGGLSCDHIIVEIRILKCMRIVRVTRVLIEKIRSSDETLFVFTVSNSFSTTSAYRSISASAVVKFPSLSLIDHRKEENYLKKQEERRSQTRQFVRFSRLSFQVIH